MLREDTHKTHHYLLKGKFIVGDKWMDHKGIVWTIDDIKENFIIVEGDISDRHIFKQVKLEECNDFLNFKIC